MKNVPPVQIVFLLTKYRGFGGKSTEDIKHFQLKAENRRLKARETISAGGNVFHSQSITMYSLMRNVPPYTKRLSGY